MIASLMMYDLPPMRTAIARYWQLIRTALADHGINAPETLSQDADEFDLWQSPALILSQTCGMPYRLRLAAKVNYVGTPDYGLKNCPPGYYQSALVVRANDPRDKIGDYAQSRFAFNQRLSQSGWAAPWAHLQPFGWWFENVTETGSHAASAQAVAQGLADIASLDAQTWRLLLRYDSTAQKLRVLEWTKPTPGLPYITSKTQDAAPITAAVTQAMTALSAGDRTTLDLQGLIQIPRDNYLAVPTPPDVTIS